MNHLATVVGGAPDDLVGALGEITPYGILGRLNFQTAVVIQINLVGITDRRAAAIGYCLFSNKYVALGATARIQAKILFATIRQPGNGLGKGYLSRKK